MLHSSVESCAVENESLLEFFVFTEIYANTAQEKMKRSTIAKLMDSSMLTNGFLPFRN